MGTRLGELKVEPNPPSGQTGQTSSGQAIRGGGRDFAVDRPDGSPYDRTEPR